jgi:hypothetical protein
MFTESQAVTPLLGGSLLFCASVEDFRTEVHTAEEFKLQGDHGKSRSERHGLAGFLARMAGEELRGSLRLMLDLVSWRSSEREERIEREDGGEKREKMAVHESEFEAKKKYPYQTNMS